MSPSTAALVFGVLVAIVVLFQLALAAGAPWGHLAMGGRHPGRFPAKLRIGAVIQAGLLGLLALVVMGRAGLDVPLTTSWPAWTIWIPVVVSGLSLLMNLATPSKAERRLWAPVAAGMLGSSLVVALMG
ncbi:hypothetical protein [Paraliomyxa miuraensis]|uniref:hypothetical protein n=1 Tax=Paraliomyxa miuraensis TaxID=376150 RepID=UPI002250FC26|nr:hypothetical protein [Paraliomyxa miuraensis]MCX4239296.1 hypothetical protein [Paraliomyxa miuraensis]